DEVERTVRRARRRVLVLGGGEVLLRVQRAVLAHGVAEEQREESGVLVPEIAVPPRGGARALLVSLADPAVDLAQELGGIRLRARLGVVVVGERADAPGLAR